MRIGRLIAAVVIIVIIAVIAAGSYVMSRGFSARLEPNQIEKFIAPRLRNLAIPSKAREAKNPVADSPDVFAEALDHYADHCSVCHGNDGSAGTMISRGMFPKVPDLRKAGTQKLSDGEIYYIIENGVRYTGMPAFGEDSNEANDEDTWKLVTFIRHIPTLTPEQINQIDQMSPKSPTDLKREEEINSFLQGGDVPVSNEHEHHHHQHQ